MDRSYLAEDQVHVYETGASKKASATFKDRPYARHGMDYYMYKGKLYPAYVNSKTQEIYILLDRPVPISSGLYKFGSK